LWKEILSLKTSVNKILDFIKAIADQAIAQKEVVDKLCEMSEILMKDNIENIKIVDVLTKAVRKLKNKQTMTDIDDEKKIKQAGELIYG